MERSKKRMALAEALKFQEEMYPVDICMYCGSEMKIEAAPSLFSDMVIRDMPQHVCLQCGECSSSLAIGAAAEALQQEFKFYGSVSIEDLLKAEREADHGSTI